MSCGHCNTDSFVNVSLSTFMVRGATRKVCLQMYVIVCPFTQQYCEQNWSITCNTAVCYVNDTNKLGTVIFKDLESYSISLVLTGLIQPALRWSKYDSTIFCLRRYHPLPDDKYMVCTQILGRTILNHDLASTNRSREKCDKHGLFRIIIRLN